MKRGIWVYGLIVLVVGCVLTPAFPIILTVYSRAFGEVITQEDTVPVNDEVVLEIVTKEGRYDTTVRSDAPIEAFSVFGDDVALYKTGDEIHKGDYAQNVTYWDTMAQVGAGYEYAIVIVNHGENDAYVTVVQWFRPNPPLLELLMCLSGLGLLMAFAGVLVTVIGLIVKISKRPLTRDREVT